MNRENLTSNMANVVLIKFLIVSAMIYLVNGDDCCDMAQMAPHPEKMDRMSIGTSINMDEKNDLEKLYGQGMFE